MLTFGLSTVILFLILILSAISKAVMDTCACCFTTSIFKNKNPLFWNYKISWKNKWKNGDPTQGEKFWGSSTIFVSFTDAWHLFQHFFLLTIFLIPIIYSQCYPIINWYWMVTDFLLIYTIFNIIFEITYRIFNKKELKIK